MERRQQEAAIEAVLFAMGESVEIDKLAEVIEESVSRRVSVRTYFFGVLATLSRYSYISPLVHIW